MTDSPDHTHPHVDRDRSRREQPEHAVRVMVDGKPIGTFRTTAGDLVEWPEPDTRPHAVARRLLERQRDAALDDMNDADEWIQRYTDDRDAARLAYHEACQGLAELDGTTTTDSPTREDRP